MSAKSLDAVVPLGANFTDMVEIFYSITQTTMSYLDKEQQLDETEKTVDLLFQKKASIQLPFSASANQPLFEFRRLYPNIPMYSVNRLSKKLGDGAEGDVFEINASLATKFYRSSLKGFELYSNSLCETFTLAKQAVCIPSHPNINRFEGIVFSTEKMQWSAAFEKINGMTLLRRILSREIPPPNPSLALDMAYALRHLNQHDSPHFDLNLGNIMISFSDERVILIDREVVNAYSLKYCRKRSVVEFGKFLSAYHKMPALGAVCKLELPLEQFGWDHIIAYLQGYFGTRVAK